MGFEIGSKTTFQQDLKQYEEVEKLRILKETEYQKRREEVEAQRKRREQEDRKKKESEEKLTEEERKIEEELNNLKQKEKEELARKREWEINQKEQLVQKVNEKPNSSIVPSSQESQKKEYPIPTATATVPSKKPQKKSVADFAFGKILGEGSFATVRKKKLFHLNQLTTLLGEIMH